MDIRRTTVLVVVVQGRPELKIFRAIIARAGATGSNNFNLEFVFVLEQPLSKR